MRVMPTMVTAITKSGPLGDGRPFAAKHPSGHDQCRWRSLPLLQLAGFAFNWCLWGFIMFLMLSQLLTAVRNTTSSTSVAFFGQDPSSGLYSVPGDNDDPYSDRLVVCVRRGHTFQAVSLADALNASSTLIEDTTGSAIHGYRVIDRTGHTLSEDSKQAWARTCRLMNATLDGIFKACEALGYTNLTRNSLHIVNGLESDTLKRIPNALPILVMPFWDNLLSARYAIPGWDGNACVFRLLGQYEDPARRHMFMISAHRTARETQTMALLGRFDGKWRNGWYEDTQGMRWYSDIIAIDPDNNFNVPARFFDPSIGQELLCQVDSECAGSSVQFSWSADLSSVGTLMRATSLTILNGARLGLFYFRSINVTVVSCVYDFASLISNASVVLLLVRWMVAMVALHRGFTKGVTDPHSAGIGSIANSSEFAYLPVAMLPRLKMILAAFYTVGCEFEGEQKALGDAWFVMYPSIVDFVLIYASLLNIVAKIARRRMNDWSFLCTIVTLSAMHYARQNIARLPFLKLGGRVNTQVGSGEFDQLTLAQMLSPEIALRMNGNASLLLWWKLLVLSISALSLLFSKSMALNSKRSRCHSSCSSEVALKVRACNVGGIGLSRTDHLLAMDKHAALSSYELVRLGYVVLDDRYLMKMSDWWIFSSMKPVRDMYSWWNHRFLVFPIQGARNGNHGATVSEISPYGKLLSLYDPALDHISWWNIDARPLM